MKKGKENPSLGKSEYLTEGSVSKRKELESREKVEGPQKLGLLATASVVTGGSVKKQVFS